jgi:hypothetical protein
MDDAGIPVTEDAQQPGARDEPGHAEQRADRLGIFHCFTLAENRTIFRHRSKGEIINVSKQL